MFDRVLGKAVFIFRLLPLWSVRNMFQRSLILICLYLFVQSYARIIDNMDTKDDLTITTFNKLTSSANPVTVSSLFYIFYPLLFGNIMNWNWPFDLFALFEKIMRRQTFVIFAKTSNGNTIDKRTQIHFSSTKFQPFNIKWIYKFNILLHFSEKQNHVMWSCCISLLQRSEIRAWGPKINKCLAMTLCC